MEYKRRQVNNSWQSKKYDDYITQKDDVEDRQKYEELLRENLWLKEQIAKKDSNTQLSKPILENNQNDIALWGMIQRNKYLDKKLNECKKKQYKQSKMIEEVQNSHEWAQRLQCKPRNCYVKKYINLLRVRSPLL